MTTRKPGLGPGIIPMVSAMRWTVGLLALLATTGCFTEDPPPSIDSTTGSQCEQGALGCECYGNGTCDTGLACDGASQLCIPTGCAPGTLACRCDDNAMCNGELACQQGVCVQPGPPPTTEGGSADDSASDTTSSMPMTTDSGETTRSTDPTTTDPSTTTGPLPTTTGGLDCDVGECQLCIDCVDNEPSACEGSYDACQGLTGCITAAMCLRDCGLTGICFDDCCDGLDMATTDAAFELTFCRTDNCPDTCGIYEFPSSCS